MLHRFTIVFATLVIFLAGLTHVRAALDDSIAAGESEVQLLVLEVENCFTCDLVRQHIQSAYARTPQSRDVPLRYIDLNKVDAGALGLVAPVTMVPTIVLVREGHEVSRLTGYTGPAIFLQAVEHMLALAE